METRDSIRSGPKPHLEFPLPNDASVKAGCDRHIGCGDIHI